MRVLIDIRHLAHPRPTGIGRYTIELLEALVRLPQAHEYLFLSTGAHAIPHRFAFLNADGVRYPELPIVRHHHIRIPNKLLTLSMAFRRKPTLNTFAGRIHDVAFLPHLNTTPLHHAQPYVLTIHDLSWHLFPHLYSTKMRLWHHLVRPTEMIWRAKHILVPSESTKRDLLAAFPTTPEQVTVVPHGVNRRFQPTFETSDHGVRSRHKLPKRFVLFQGTLEPRKNLLILIDAVAHYRERTHDDLHLVVSGTTGWNQHLLHRRLQEPAIQSFVHPLGYVPDDDQPALYRAALAFVWPSLYEGFGLPILEAMACGTPVITSLTSSLPEVTGNAALLVDPTRASDIQQALKELLQTPNLREHLSTAGLTRAKNFTWESAAKKTLTILEKVGMPSSA